MIQLLIVFFVVALGGYYVNRMLQKEKGDLCFTDIRFVLATSFLSVNISVLFVRVCFGKSIFLIQTLQGVILYDLLIISIACGFVYLMSIMREKIRPKRGVKVQTQRRVLTALLKIIVLMLFVCGVFLWSWASWFVDFFGELTPEQFLFNLNSPLKGTSSDMVKFMSHTPILIVGTVGVLFAFLLFTNIAEHFSFLKMNTSKRRMIALGCVSGWTFIFGLSYCIQTLHLSEVYRAYHEDSKYFDNNYVDPGTLNLQFPEKKRNLIHIYAESMESSFFSKELGGHMDENLLPELYQLSQTGVHFSNTDKMGGSIQTYGSSWSVAGMVNMENGVPLKIPMEGNSYGKDGDFLPGITNLGDMLHKQGYNQTIMFGADAEFGGLDVYFTQHGKYHIFDVKEARKQGLIPQDYNVWWGYEDDKLFDYAQQEITRLYQTGKPFHFNMETADTHFPDGYVSPNLKRSRASQYADVIAYSDAQIVAFVKWIQAQPFYDNTTIVITGDHLSMDRNFFKTFDSQYKRTPFNLFLNAKVDHQNTKTKNRQFAPLDIFPTMVASLGIEIPGNRLGLGTNLFSSEPTLIERDGFETFNGEIGLRSNFYNERFIAKKEKKHKRH